MYYFLSFEIPSLVLIGLKTIKNVLNHLEVKTGRRTMKTGNSSVAILAVCLTAYHNSLLVKDALYFVVDMLIGDVVWDNSIYLVIHKKKKQQHCDVFYCS